LADELQALGMVLAFGDRADFSGISAPDELAISRVIHQAFVDVTEGGTEAAAATASLLAPPAPGPGGGRGPEAAFRADHPFLFLIRDRGTGAILFVGRVTDPSAGAVADRPVNRRPVKRRPIEP
jgi:serpin B